MKKPLPVYLLIIMMFFQFLSAIVGVYILLFAPSGSVMRLPSDMIEKSPFPDTIIPGLILLVFLCILPAIIVFGLIFKPSWYWIEKLNIYKDKQWPWTLSVYFGIILIIWIIVQEAMIGGGNVLQTIYGSLGVAILIVSLLPSVMKFYSK